jgi:membrane protease YdiL (CAAX protease family)
VRLALASDAPGRVRRELVATWAGCIGLLVLARLLGEIEPTGLLRANIAGVAAFLFIAWPEHHLRARGERWSSFGFPWSGLSATARLREWGHGAAFALGVCAVVFPAFLLLFWGFGELLPSLPRWLSSHLAPYGATASPTLRLPPRFPIFVLVQLLVVALPEELFYRGWMQTSWAATAPGKSTRLLGATLGAGFLWTQVLFALGHLVAFHAWRLGTFFPGLLFGWVRARSGSLVAPIIVHALSNVFLAVLEASFYP